MTKKVNVYSLDGTVSKQIQLPERFSEEEYRTDLVRRAVLSDESRLYQPKGNYVYAGMETSAKYRGRKEMYGAIKNMGISRLPREVLPNGQFGRVRRIPSSVKGRRAHPPRIDKKIVEKVNKKEYRKALLSALAAVCNSDLVKKRYSSRVSASLSALSFPIVVDNSFEKLKKAKEVSRTLVALKLGDFMDNAKKSGTKSILIIVDSGDVLKSATNVAGVDVVSVRDLKVRHLAPGTHGGRITLFSEAAVNKINETFSGGNS